MTDRTDAKRLVRVEPQPTYIESSGRWCWPLPAHACLPGCCTEVVTASREWWEYAPSEAKPHPMAEGVMLRDQVWYWAVPTTQDTELLDMMELTTNEAIDCIVELNNLIKRLRDMQTAEKANGEQP